MFEQRVPFNAAPATPRSTSSVDPFGQRRGVEPSLIDLVLAELDGDALEARLANLWLRLLPGYAQ